MNQIIYNTIAKQTSHQDRISHRLKKDNGVFFTNEIRIVDSILSVIDFENGILNKKILEPAVGNGIFLLKTIERAYQYYPDKEVIRHFIENCLFFIDIDPEMIRITKNNITELYEDFFQEQYRGTFNAFVYDFTEKVKTDLSLFNETKNLELENLLETFNYVIGNPPYVTLYGRRDRKRNELQRINYLSQYRQFPQNMKNGKINYVMLFLEHSLDYLKIDGKLAFIIDISFYETAYKYTRKYLLENTKILAIENNISNFDGVASGQLIIKLEKTPDRKNMVTVKDYFTQEIQNINQLDWLNEIDEYRFRLIISSNTQNILNKIKHKSTNALIEQFPNKSLRTCTMLLDMEDKFVGIEQGNINKCKYYRYYQGSKALYDKYCIPFYDKYFYYDKELQDKINNKLKEELTIKGIKNKKRIGLGDYLVYDNPKIFIRQSAKEILATYDESMSSANNSLYVFSLRKADKKSREFLKYLCGYLNSAVCTFYAQKMEVIRYRKGKQPQIKISDLYSIPIPTDTELIRNISKLVGMIYMGEDQKLYEEKINDAINKYFDFTEKEIDFINTSILEYLKS